MNTISRWAGVVLFIGSMLNGSSVAAEVTLEEATIALPQVASGRIERLPAFESGHVPARHVDVWLPDGYPSAAPYAVLYMHDGQMLFDAGTTWNGQEWRVDETSAELIRAGKVRPFIVVGVWNGGPARAAEYLPQRVYDGLAPAMRERLLASRRGEQGFLSGSVYSDRYLRFLVEELIPSIESRYAVAATAEARVLMGSSMGGLISLYGLSEHPSVFGAAACLSTHWPGSFLLDDPALPEALLGYIEAQLPAAGRHRLYFDHGTATLDAWYPPWQARVDELLRDKGYSASDWQSLSFPDAEHSEQAWAARLDRPLEFLFPPRPAEAEEY
jgi:enterochelin esterase-like enzyme